ncbi:MAG: metallophosphoesterase [Candidatus Thermoplasmatota archaeon]|nr:metallophosphoesterase [Candidatus Thermoplasmatota archaeon]
MKIFSDLKAIFILSLIIMASSASAFPAYEAGGGRSTDGATRGASSLVLERPRLALPAIRTPGEVFEVWFRGEGIEHNSVFNVTIIGDGATYSLKIMNLTGEAGRWILLVGLSNGTLIDLYDIRVNVDTQEQYQVNAVSVVSEYKNRFKFVQMSDIHIDEKNSVANFRKAVREINLINPELVIITGDSYDADPTGSGTPDQQQAEMFIDLCKGFKVPVYVVTGNHEYSYRNAEGINIYRNTINPLLDYTFNYGTHHFIGLNCGHWQVLYGAVPHPDNKVESFTDEQMEWITDDLTEHENDTMKLIFMHAPLKTNNGKDTPMWRVEDMENLMIEKDVKAFIAGHTHRDEIIDVNGNVLSGDWQAPDYPLVIHTATGGAKETVEECSYRVFMVNNDTFDYYTYDDDGDGVRSAIASTPTGYIDVEINGPNDGSRVSAEFTVTNNQYEDIEDGRVILKLATPPKGIDYCVNDGDVINVYDTEDGQIVHVQVSVPRISQKTFTVFQMDITPPSILKVYSKYDNNLSGIYERGSEVEIIVQERNLETGLYGSLSIGDEEDQTVINNAALMDSGGGRYTYLWDTEDVVPGKNYRVFIFLEDNAGNFDRSKEFNSAHNITIVDTIPPEIKRVSSGMNGDNDNMYSIGSVVRISVEEANDEEDLSGNVIIARSGNQTVYNSSFPLTEEGGGYYYFLWDTIGLPDGKYLVETQLVDEWGNRDDGLWPSADLIIQLVDDFPPVVASVESMVEMDGAVDNDGEYPLGRLVHFQVKESNDEENLSGELIISREDDGTVMAVIPLEGIPGLPGSYGADWNSYGVNIGIFHVDSKLWDHSGNMDSDGSPGKPDHTFKLIDQEKPRILETIPLDDEIDIPISSKITLIFSEPIVYDRLQIAVRIEDLYFNEIPFHVEWFEINSTALLIPEHFLSYYSTYALILTDKITDRAGNRLNQERVIRFTTLAFSPGEKIDGRYSLFPPPRKLFLEPDDLTNFSIYLVNPETRELPLHYSWYLNGLQLDSGPNASQYLLNATDLSMENSYELEVRVTGEKVEISDYWVIQLREDENDDVGMSHGDTYSATTLKWAYGAGIFVVFLGFFLIVLYLYLRRRKQSMMLENELRLHIFNENEAMDDGEEEGDVEGDVDEHSREKRKKRGGIKRIRTSLDSSSHVKNKSTIGKSKRKRKSLEMVGKTPIVEILPPTIGWPASGARDQFQPGTHLDVEIIDIEPLLKQDYELSEESGRSIEDTPENLRDIVDEFIRDIQK